MRWADIYHVPTPQTDQKPDVTAAMVTPSPDKKPIAPDAEPPMSEAARLAFAAAKWNAEYRALWQSGIRRGLEMRGSPQPGKTYRGRIVEAGEMCALQQGMMNEGYIHGLREVKNARLEVSDTPVEISYSYTETIKEMNGTVKPYVEQRRGGRSRGR